ncbi:MAG: Unknown protein [uncultured Aureispira sp.]|uniref:Secretion system C-terminal sorting domain-containing protein n=1 Tax=uncultured Aureispira sp. TaxID=1331704 RepID=A0A6S6TLE2_9BACT|nr:MAG: Unknown protein [uncultured Aureispira sp.]
MKIACLVFILFSFQLVACSQTVRTISSLPSTLSENSGMLISHENAIWLHNDGGDSAKLYLIDTFGTVLKTILIHNVTNIDWEDITYDNQGRVYIGEFGNNNNSRQNLKVYRIPHPDSITGNTVAAETIEYHYPEQTAFPPIDREKKYDTEAMIHFQDSLYLFTKDRTSPHQGYTWLYQISADTGSHAAILLDSFQTNQISYIFEVTGAAMSPNQEQLALLGANTVWWFTGFTGNRFFDGMVQTISLQSTTQKEALDFVDNERLYFSNETSFLGGASLGELNLSSLMTSNALVVEQTVLEHVLAYPNPTDKQLSLEFELDASAKVSIQLLDARGKIAQRFPLETLSAGKQLLDLSIDALATGTYFLQLKCGQQKYTKRIVIAR